MRLEITRRADLATRALLELAKHGGRMKSSALAELVDTTPGFLSQAMTPMVARGWVSSEPGPSGGYQVSVAPTNVSALEIIEAIEGPTDTDTCVLAGSPCNQLEPCALHAAWSNARSHLLMELRHTTLATLLRNEPQ